MSLAKKAVNKIAARVGEALHVVKYGAPNPLMPGVAGLSEQAAGWLETLRHDGVVKIEAPRIAEFSRYLDQEYFSHLRDNDDIDAFNRAAGAARLVAAGNPGNQEWGQKLSVYASLRDAAILDFLMDAELTALLYNYYRRQPYYRNNPALDSLDYRGGDTKNSDSFHVDNFRQVSYMLLVSGTTENDTHMRFAMGSHRRPLLVQGVAITPEKARALAPRYPICKLTGAPGTLYVFDTTGIHKRELNVGAARKILHANITTGHHMVPTTDTLDGWDLARYPTHSRRMLEKLLKGAAQ